MNIMQYKNKVFREFEAKHHDKLETTHEMRRLANGGDKFHPYLWKRQRAKTVFKNAYSNDEKLII